LGIVISQCASANLDLSQNFITVIPQHEINNKEYIDNAISKNREISITNRLNIQEYSKNFRWNVLVPKYVDLITRLVNQQPTIVSCYFKIPNKRNHEFYVPFIRNFLKNVNQECIFWTTQDIQDEFKDIKNSHIQYTILTKIPESFEFPMTFWEQHKTLDMERYHTAELAKVWFLKKWFVLETAKLKNYELNHKFIWCDAGCIRSDKAVQSLLNFGNRYDLQDHKMHIQLLKRTLEYKQTDIPCFIFPTIKIGCAIMFGTKEAWFIYNALYNDMLHKYDQANISAVSDQYVTLSCIKNAKSAFELHSPNDDFDNEWFHFLETI
jgi:hypothetical protein